MRSRIPLIVVLTLLLTIAPLMTSCNSPDNVKMKVTINGLEKGEEATLTISHEGATKAEEPLFQQTITSNGEKNLIIDISTSLIDGYYLLLLEIPEKYFRDPKGYLFSVAQSQIVNPTKRSVIFTLLPKQETPAVEVIRDLSAPEKQPPSGIRVKGSFSGLLNDDLVTIHIYDTYTGKEKLWGTSRGNKPWDIGIIKEGEVGKSGHFTITAEVPGYRAQPESYKIQIIGDTAYVMSDNVTDEEAIHLDFRFFPKET